MTQATLKEMLSFQMDTYGSEYDEFTAKYFSGLKLGRASSYHKILGKNPKNLFACTYTGTSKYTGKNDLIEKDKRIYLDTKNFRNSANNFNHITSAYILLRLIENKVPGIYLFLSQTIEKGKFINGTEDFRCAQEKNDIGYKIKECDFTFFLGNFGNENLYYTSLGHRTASDDFARKAATHFNLKPKLDHTVQARTGVSTAMFNLAEIVPENVSIPCGVDHVNGIKNITDDTAHNFFADYEVVENLITKLSEIKNLNLSTQRVPGPLEYTFNYNDSYETHSNHQNQSSTGFMAWLTKLFF